MLHNVCVVISHAKSILRRVTLGDCAISGGCSEGVEQSASTDQGHLVAVVFSAAD